MAQWTKKSNGRSFPPVASHVYLYNEKMEIVETYTEDKDWAGLDYEIESVNECLRKGLKTHPVITWEHTHEMFDIIEVCKEQMGVDYEEYEAL